MRSPFPGMDPYIECQASWESFHAKLIAQIDQCLADRLPRRYCVEVGQRSYISLVEEDGKKKSPFLPDVNVTTARGKPDGGLAVAADPATDLDEVEMEATVSDAFREKFVEILDVEDGQALVTSIEVLSPSNKRPGTEGWRQFLRKRYSLIESKVNIVEIDLLRGGVRLPLRQPWPDGPYAVLVSRGERSPRARVTRAHYREPLPTVAVPLLPADADAPLDLQPLLDVIYHRSRFHERLDYRAPLDPPLPEADAAWLAEALAASQGK